MVAHLRPEAVWPLGRWVRVGAGARADRMSSCVGCLGCYRLSGILPGIKTPGRLISCRSPTLSAGKAGAPGAVGLLAWAILCQRLAAALLGRS